MIRKMFACAVAAILAASMTPTKIVAGDNTVSATASGQTAHLELNTTLGDEDAKSILGTAQYYGITGNEWNFNGEAETNFAVNKFTHQNNGSGGQTGITNQAKGSDVGHYVAGSVDKEFQVKGQPGVIYTTEESHDKFNDPTGKRENLTFHEVTEEQVSDYISDMLGHIQSESDRLAELDSIQDYTNMPSNQMTLDITSAGDKTVYLNVSKSDGLKNMFTQSSGVTIVKNPGQKVVFNFTGSDPVTLQKIVVKQNGTQIDGATIANTSTAVNNIEEDLIYNIPDASSVTLQDTAGIILAPKATVNFYGVDGGWIIADKVNSGAEWHFNNGTLPDEIPDTPDKPKTTPTPTPTVTPTPTPSVTPTPKPTPSSTPEVTPTPKPTPSSTPEVTPTPKPTPSSTPEVTPTPKPTPSSTPEVTPTPKPTPSSTPEVTPTPKPTPSSTPDVTPTPSSTPEVTPTPSTTPDVTPVPDETPTPSGTPEPTPEVTETPAPSETPVTVTERPRLPRTNRKPEEEKKIRLPRTSRKESPDTNDETKSLFYGVVGFSAVAVIGLVLMYRRKYSR